MKLDKKTVALVLSSVLHILGYFGIVPSPYQPAGPVPCEEAE